MSLHMHVVQEGDFAYSPLPRTGGVNYVTPTTIVATNHGLCRLPIMGKSEVVGLVEHVALVCLANWKVTI